MQDQAKANIIKFVTEEAIAQGCLVSIQVEGECCVEPTCDPTDIFAVLSEVEDGQLYFYRGKKCVGRVDFSDCTIPGTISSSTTIVELT
jgi:hypothetical protein